MGHRAGFDDFVGHLLRQAGRDGEAQPNAAGAGSAGFVRHRGARRGYADELAGAVGDGASAVAGIYGGVSLDGGHEEGGLAVVARDGDGAVEGADDATRHCAGKTQGGAHDDHRLSHVRTGRVEGDGGQTAGLIDLDDRQVGLRVSAGEGGRSGGAVAKEDLESTAVDRRRNDVVVGQDIAIAADDLT